MNTAKLNKLEDFYYALCRALEYINEHVFENVFTRLIFVIQGERAVALNTYGVCSDKRWKVDGEKICEITLTAEAIQWENPIKILETLVHEMVHYYAAISDIKDTDKTGRVHNKKFKELGERFGLQFHTRDPRLGWCVHEPDDNLRQTLTDCVKVCGLDQLKEYQRIKPPKGESKKTFFNYRCPACFLKIKAKLDMHLICGNDGVAYEFDDKLPGEDPLDINA